MRYPATGRNDEPMRADGDVAFLGVDQRVSPPSLAPGYVADARNCRFNEGKAQTRPGLMVLPVCKGNGSTPFGEIYGGAIFSDPITGVEWWIIAADGGVWRTGAGRAAVAMPLPEGVTLSNSTFKQLVQCFNVLVLLRGDGEAPLVCTDLDAGFGPVPSEPTGDYTEPMPPSPYGVFWLNRLLLVHDRDGLAVSDVQNYTRWLPATGAFRIQGGNNDRLVAVQPLGQSTLICLKDQSVLRLDGLDQGEENARLGNVTQRFGCVAPRTVVDVGADLYWLSERGVVSLQQTNTNAIQATDQALSDPLLPTIRRINPRAVSEACAEAWDGKLYVAVPLDDARLYGPDLIAHGPTADSTSPTADSTEATADMEADRYGGDDGDLTVSVLPGQRYLYQQGSRGESLTNGTEILTGSGTFTAQGIIVTLQPRDVAVSKVCNDTLRLIRRESTNNAVMVYSFINQAWAGIDQGDAVCIRQFLKITYRGVRRLAALCDDGFLRLYEEGRMDYVPATVATPTLTLIQIAPCTVSPACTLRVATGETLTFGSDGWTGSGIDEQLANLWNNATSGNGRGYDPSGADPYEVLDCVPSRVNRGLKFTSTNGEDVLDTVINGYGLTPDNLGDAYAQWQADGNDWARVFFFQGDYVRQIPIRTELVTRGYAMQSPDQKRFHWLNVELFTWNPRYSLSLRTGSVGREEAIVTGSTRDGTKSFIANTEDRLADNSDDRHEEEGFEDYSLTLPSDGFQCGSGIILSHDQAQTHRLPLRERAAYVQLRLVNTTGVVDVRGVQVEGGSGAVEGGIQY